MLAQGLFLEFERATRKSKIRPHPSRHAKTPNGLRRGRTGVFRLEGLATTQNDLQEARRKCRQLPEPVQEMLLARDTAHHGLPGRPTYMPDPLQPSRQELAKRCAWLGWKQDYQDAAAYLATLKDPERRALRHEAQAARRSVTSTPSSHSPGAPMDDRWCTTMDIPTRNQVIARGGLARTGVGGMFWANLEGKPWVLKRIGKEDTPRVLGEPLQGSLPGRIESRHGYTRTSTGSFYNF